MASPTSEVKAAKGDYVTLFGDPIINPIPGSMSGNANGSPGHAFVNAYLGQLDPYTKIVKKMNQLLPTLDSELSQWETDQEYEKGAMSYRIRVKHRFDNSVILNKEVYPFAPSKKLYQVNGEYVKASCGGEKISPSWVEKEEHEFYLLEGTGEKIVASTLIFVEDFEDKAIGWTNNKRDGSAGLTTFLGRFGGSQGTQEISKTYSFGEAYKNREVLIIFDMYQIDSWDGDSYFNLTYENGIEKFQTYINNQLVIEDIYIFGQLYGNQTSQNEFFGWGSEGIHHYELNAVTDESGNIMLGFGSTLNQGIDDESYGIDNVKVKLANN